jgi:hypothetical protein
VWVEAYCCVTASCGFYRRSKEFFEIGSGTYMMAGEE